MKWFKNPQTIEELKKQYKSLALQHHPDIGGSDTEMKEINAEYDMLFGKLKNVHQTAEGTTYTSREGTNETPGEFKDIINRLIKFDGIHIEICGSWIWITGRTIDYREQLKQMRFRWSKSKTAWYYHYDEYRKTTKRTYTLDEIRDLYGSETIKTAPQLKLSIV